MGFRFYRRFSIFPGVTLNLSKSGVSLSLGVRGARITLGKNGVRKTIGVPGSGVSHSSVSSWKSLLSLWRKKGEED